MKKQLLLLAMILLPLVASADGVEIDGIYYNLVSKIKEAEVTSNPNKYRGTVVIPESVTYEGLNYNVMSIGSSAFYYCSGLTSINIPNNVKRIGASAFSGCSRLIFATIGSGIKNIGQETFASCPELTDVYCYATDVPNTNTDAFKDSYIEYATLHVPVESVDAYKAAEPWKNFKEIVALTDDDPKPDATGISVVRNAEGNKAVIYDLNGVRQSEPKKGINIVNGKKVVVK